MNLLDLPEENYQRRKYILNEISEDVMREVADPFTISYQNLSINKINL